MTKQKVYTSRTKKQTKSIIVTDIAWFGNGQYEVGTSSLGGSVSRRLGDKVWTYDIPIFIQKERWGIK